MTGLLMNSKARLDTLESRLLPLLPGDAMQNARTIRAVVNEAKRELAEYDPAMFRAKGRRKVASADDDEGGA